MGRFGHFVVDADGHGGDLPNWQDRLPPEFQGHMAKRRERIKQVFANLPGVGIKETKGTAKLNSLERPGMTDPKSRLEDMDLEGIDVTVMFPGGAGEEWAGLDPRFASALCRTLNDARGALGLLHANAGKVREVLLDALAALRHVRLELRRDAGLPVGRLAAVAVGVDHEVAELTHGSVPPA